MPPRARQRGDYTGQETERLQRENADELAKRQQEVGLVNEVDLVIEQEGIFDPASGDLIEMPPEAEAKVRQMQESVVVVEDDPILEPGQAPVMDPMKVFQPLEPQQKQKEYRPSGMEIEDLGEEPIIVTEPEYRVMRVNSDIEDMTFGVGNTFTLKRGMRYRVSTDLYDWLESKGLVYH